jgi:hypothetical protein
MVFLNLNKRLQDLENNITQDLELLEECEKALRNEDKPRIKRYYRSEIERQKESVNDYEKQYSKLKQELADEPTARIQTVEKQLQSLNDKVNVLLSSQLAIYQDLNHMRQTLLERYDEGEQAIITAIAQQLNESQLELTQKLLEAVEANQVSETEMQQMLTAIEENIHSLPPSQATTAKIIRNPDLDVRQRLKVSLPLVPLLVQYEVELELGTNFNIKSAWGILVNKLGGK